LRAEPSANEVVELSNHKNGSKIHHNI
jgi:hypothetical protein